MYELNSGARFLQQKYKLNKDPGVVATAKKTNIPKYDYQTRIQSYLNRLSHLINPPPLKEEHSNFDRKQRNLKILERSLYNQIIIKPDEIPESYFQSIIQRHEDEGRPIKTIPDDIKRDLIDTVIKDQGESLNIWVDYLSSSDAKYPDWFKYYAFRSVLVMGRYDKGKKKFQERSKTGKSVSQFPELIRDALSFVADALEKKQKNTLISLTYGNGIKPEEKVEFEKLLKEGDPNFASLYAWAIDKITPISEELLQQTKGQWVKYPKGSDPQKVVDALAQYGTGWCIRGEGTARQYLKRSDLEIYFSLDNDSKPSIPRIVIVTSDGKIDEVRGVAEQEHWDPYITDVVERKLAELPDGQKFKKRIVDMQEMTTIHRHSFLVDKKTGVKTYLNPALTKKELRFIYELDDKIEGFGYKIPDPRIKEILAKRNIEEDMLVIFDCKRNQIARNVNEIHKDTKVYIGKLGPNVFKLLPHNIEYIFTSFTDGKKIFRIKYGGKSKDALWDMIYSIDNILVTPHAENAIYYGDYTTSTHRRIVRMIKLKIKDLEFNESTKYSIILKRALSLGLELCPPESALFVRLTDVEQKCDDIYYIAMKQIMTPPTSSDDKKPNVFVVSRLNDSELILDSYFIYDGSHFNPDDEFLFQLPT